MIDIALFVVFAPIVAVIQFFVFKSVFSYIIQWYRIRYITKNWDKVQCGWVDHSGILRDTICVFSLILKNSKYYCWYFDDQGKMENYIQVCYDWRPSIWTGETFTLEESLAPKFSFFSIGPINLSKRNVQKLQDMSGEKYLLTKLSQ